ncbi:MAG: hypothetical protein KDD11_04140 [Acidobacteria bacterium]|nr:hypothetical protein [Acidobacteriota bacterium]
MSVVPEPVGAQVQQRLLVVAAVVVAEDEKDRGVVFAHPVAEPLEPSDEDV